MLDETDAMVWLRYEVTGYPSGKLDTAAWSAAGRSGRIFETERRPPRENGLDGTGECAANRGSHDRLAGKALGDIL